MQVTGHHWLLITSCHQEQGVTTHPVYWPLAIAHHHTLNSVQAEVTRQTLCVCQYLHNQVHYNIAQEQMSHLSRVSPLISSRLCHSQKWVWPTQVFVRPSVGGWWPGWPGGSGGTLHCSLPTQICNEINWKWGLDTGQESRMARGRVYKLCGGWHCNCLSPQGDHSFITWSEQMTPGDTQPGLCESMKKLNFVFIIEFKAVHIRVFYVLTSSFILIHASENKFQQLQGGNLSHTSWDILRMNFWTRLTMRNIFLGIL